MKTVVVAGATGYLGQYICAEYSKRGWHVRALVRNAKKAQELNLHADEFIVAEATQANSLAGCMKGADLVVSALGITRQRDGLSYWNVDFQANVNLLNEALRAKASRFAYIHVIGANKMQGVSLVAAKQAFVDELVASPIETTVIAPSGYFSDMEDFLSMAKSGRAWLFGDGHYCLNPIHGADLAMATADAIDKKLPWLDVGGPDIFSQKQLANLAFKTSGNPTRITFLPDLLRKAALFLLRLIAPKAARGPAEFFLTSLGMNMIGEPHGVHHLEDFFQKLTDDASN